MIYEHNSICSSVAREHRLQGRQPITNIKYSFVRAFSSSALIKCFIHPSLPPNGQHSFTLLKGYPGCQRLTFYFPFSQRELIPLKPVTLLLEMLRRSQIAASTLKNLSQVQGKKPVSCLTQNSSKKTFFRISIFWTSIFLLGGDRTRENHEISRKGGNKTSNIQDVK